MSAAALLARLHQRGVELRDEGGTLHYSAPKGAITADLRSELLDHKAEILAILRQNSSSARSSDGRRSATSTADAPESFAGQRRSMSLDAAELAASHPFVRYVNPYLGSWLSRLNLDKQFVRGEGCWLYDAQGTRYLDFIAQYGAVPFGYNPPEIWEAIEKVRRDQIPSFVQPSILTAAGELAERLIGIAPAGLHYVTFANSGAEAVEVALKLCRSATGRRGILAVRNSFHGKTLGAVSATGNFMYQGAFGAPVEGFHHVPFGNIEALRNALAEHKGFYAAFIVEPIQGEGGIVEPPAGYLAQAQELCQAAGTLFVLDEVQTGLGRTGKLFACDHDGLVPDVMTLAKALGGGLMPIGACLCRKEVYNAEFGIRHSSTFAGNTLACQAALATLDLLEKDEGAIVRQVAQNGTILKQELLKLQRSYPALINSVRGRGYILGVELDLDSFVFTDGLLGYLADQELLGYVVCTYLLNVEKIRVAPTASAHGVLRVEPPLIAPWSQCQMFVDGFARTLEVLATRDIARLMGHLIGAEVVSSSRPQPSPLLPTDGAKRVQAKVGAADGRFAFLIHLTGPGDFANLDPSLNVFDQEQLMRLRNRGAGLLAPARFSEVLIESRTGQKAYGEFIAVPYTASELVQMSHATALSEVALGVEVARKRGAQIVGLGGFTSVVTLGGLALKEHGSGPLTTGNSYTVAAARRGVKLACQRRGRQLSRSSLAVVGATGAVGRATALLISDEVARLTLTGNPAHPERSRARLLEVAASILERLWELHARDHHQFASGTLGASLVSMSGRIPARPVLSDFAKLAEQLERNSGLLCLSTDLSCCLPDVDVIITATSAVEGILDAEYLKRDAIVCELSRPFNATPEVKASRPDVLFVEGGLVCAPSEPDIGWDLGHRQGIVFACMAETMMLALERRYQDTSLGVNLDLRKVQELDALADKHGFTVLC
jgi:acetylornithine/succinyldiaminopimelate/putrescine aminotransferase/predicted amino acid dehydrogenase